MIIILIIVQQQLGATQRDPAPRIRFDKSNISRFIKGGGAVETVCSGSHYSICCFII